MKKYEGKRREEVAPHVYAIAEEAYRNLINSSSKFRNQTILITGESGAGKTEVTKRIIQYLTLGTNQDDSDKVSELEEQLIEMNPMLEAFGNAKTVNNNNSSRFGKFIEIQFNDAGKIVGSLLTTYNLEKSRVTEQTKEDRNYHIFYQLLAGASSKMRTELNLGKPEEYKILYQNKTSPKELIVDGMDDFEEFHNTIKAMRTMNISEEEQQEIFRILAGMLHLGNVEYSQGKEGAEIVNKETFVKAAELLGVDSVSLEKAIIHPTLITKTEITERNFSKKEAEDSTKAMLKTIYHKLFEYLVDVVNKTMGRTGNYSIGILDIAGFEIFRENSLEQLLINLTNEKLQQFFNNHMFKIEQQEYIVENIPWSQQNFGEDAQPVINLIEQKNPPGLLALLDEQSSQDSGNDSNFHNNICNTFGRGNSKFRKPKFGGRPGDYKFDIVHYAGDVTYNADGWVDKNRDPLERDIRKVLSGSTSNSIINKIFRNQNNSSIKQQAKSAKLHTVSANHKTQLEDLMKKLRMTSPHFIRCILPNTQKRPKHFVDSTVLKQLKCNGVLEGIRITRMGYPNRITYSEFLKRYHFLCDNIPKRSSDEKAVCIDFM